MNMEHETERELGTMSTWQANESNRSQAWRRETRQREQPIDSHTIYHIGYVSTHPESY